MASKIVERVRFNSTLAPAFTPIFSRSSAALVTGCGSAPSGLMRQICMVPVMLAL